jgi:PAS domain S-box-containing protein
MDRFATAEPQRLEALRGLGVMDTPAEALLDGLVRTAAALCEAPMAMISLIDARRQWIKASVGLEGYSEWPLEISLCTTVLEARGYVEIPDTRADARVNELACVVDGPHMGFYAGAPLQTPDGHVIGTLCVMDSVARTGLQPGQRAALQELARTVMQALLLRQAAHRTLQSSSEQMFRELSETCPVGIFHTDAQGNCIYTNPQWREIYGMSFEDALGHGWARGIHPEDQAGVFVAWERVTSTGQPFDYSFRVLRADQSVVHVRVRGRAIALPDQSTGGYVGSVVDISDEVAYQQQLRATNEFLARAEEIAGVGGWRFDLASRKPMWTHQTRRIFELPTDYVPQGDEHLRYFSPQAQQQIRETAESCMQDGGTWDLQLPMVTAAGRAVWVRSVGQIEMQDGRPVAVVGVLQDVTESRSARAALTESQERLHRALEGSALVLWDLDVPNETIYLSETWSEMLGGGRKDTICTAQELLSLVPFDDLQRIQAALEPVLEGTSPLYRVQHQVRRHDGTLFWIHSEGRVAERDAEGLPLRMVGTNRDISQLKRDEHDLRIARDAADAANRAKSQFLATMSHEIRTPLNGIIGMTKLLLDEQLSSEVRRHADLIDRSALSLLALVNDILDVSKIEAGQMEIESVSFDLHELLEDLATLYQLRATEKSLLFRLRIDPGVPRIVEADPTRIRQVLVNLLGNALKFTQSGWIGLHVKASPLQEGFTLELTVADTGIGIPTEVQPQLFTRFMQADSSTSRKFGGSGLGLSIVRQLVELMGGSVTVSSTPAKGSRFRVQVPVVPGHHVPAVSGFQDLPRGTHTARVLVAEDNTTNQVVAFGMLHKLGFEDVSLAGDGLQAFEMGRGDGFDVILMDCQMPEMDGYEATRRLRASGCTSAIIAMTANAIKGDRERCLEAGMNDYLTKPIDLKVLGAVLARWVAPADATPTPPGELPLFSPEVMRARFGGDEELEQVALASFQQSTPPLLSRLHAALAAQNREQVALLAHSAKGAGSMICAERYAAFAAVVEDTAGEAGFDELARLTGEMQRAFEGFRLLLQQP